MIRFFEGDHHAKSYARYRPAYPSEVAERILDYCREGNGDNQLALDVGCGSGQSTRILAPHFKEVIGIDPSAAQIKCAFSKFSNVKFKVGSSDNLLDVCDKNSVDLVTCAQSFHWFEGDTFYQQCRKVLKPNGVMALYGYDYAKFHLEEANKIIKWFDEKTLDGYWDPNRYKIDERYSNVSLPFKDFKRVDNITMTKTLSLTDFIGYLSTLQAYPIYLKDHPDSPILQDLCNELYPVFAAEYATPPGPECLQIEPNWSVFILLGRNDGD